MSNNYVDDVFGRGSEKIKKQLGKSPRGGLVFAFLIFIAFFGAITCFYTVETEEEAIVIRLGKYIKTTGPGLHYKVPFNIDKVIKVKTQLIHQEEFGFRTLKNQNFGSSRSSYSNKNFEHESLMVTGDLNVADVEWVVHYRISDPFKFLFQASSPQQNIRDVSESVMRRLVGDRLVTEVLTTGRVEISAEAKKLMQEILDKYDIGVQVVTVKLQDVNPPDSVKASFNEVNEAKQEQEKVINQAEEAYNRVIPEARGKADKEISEAEGYAKALVNRAKGDADKFRSVLIEFNKAPKITKKRIYLETMEEIYSKFEELTIVDSAVKGLLPVYQGKAGGQ